MFVDVLPLLAKAGGISALAIGAAYLLYSQIIKAGVIPRLRQWQGFVLLCLLAVLIFAIAVLVLIRRDDDSPSLKPAQIHIEAPSKVDIRSPDHPSDSPTTWHTGRATLIHDITFKSIEEPSRSAFVSGVRASLTIDEVQYPFEWKSFVNMHEEQDKKWLAITGDARTFQVPSGSAEYKEILHQSNPIQSYEKVLLAILESRSATARLVVKSTVDNQDQDVSCTVNLHHWRKVLNEIVKANPGALPARFTMCCTEHPKSKQDALCGPVE
jgi:hypothetical protein